MITIKRLDQLILVFTACVLLNSESIASEVEIAPSPGADCTKESVIECAICLEPIIATPRDHIIYGFCHKKHILHKVCCDKLFETGSNACPTCRGTFYVEDWFNAAKMGKLQKVDTYIRTKPNVDATNLKGHTALILSALFGHIDIARLLIAKGADVNIAGEHNWAPLIAAVRKYGNDTSTKLVQFLLENGANPNAAGSTGETALVCAAGNGTDDIVKLLITHKADVNQADFYKKTPLIKAAFWGHFTTAKILLENGAKESINARDDRGYTALMYVAKDADFVALLREYGATE